MGIRLYSVSPFRVLEIDPNRQSEGRNCPFESGNRPSATSVSTGDSAQINSSPRWSCMGYISNVPAESHPCSPPVLSHTTPRCLIVKALRLLVSCFVNVPATFPPPTHANTPLHTYARTHADFGLPLGSGRKALAKLGEQPLQPSFSPPPCLLPSSRGMPFSTDGQTHQPFTT